MLVADYIAQFLVEKGIKDVFLIDGSACASMIVGVARNKDLNYYCPQHEQAGAFAIDGYAKAAGNPSVMIATSGPAGQNLINGIAAGFYDSVPAIYLTGNINSRFFKPSKNTRQHGFQEHDIVTMVDNVTKYATVVMRADHIRYELEKAYDYAVSGRPGPVLLDIPMDIQKTEIDESSLIGYAHNDSAAFELSDLDGAIQETLTLLNVAKRPAILLGGGVWLSRQNEQVKQLIDTLKIPFFETWNMIDFCENDHPYYAGRVGTYGGDGRNFAIQNCDLLLCLGTRISGRITGGMIDKFARGAKKIITDIDGDELLWQIVKGDLNIKCDLNDFMSSLTGALKISPYNQDVSAWSDKAITWKNKYKTFQDVYWEQKESVNPYVFVKVLSEELSEGALLIHETGGNAVVTSQTFEAKKNQRVFSNHGNSSLGYALPAAIGAAIATKKSVNCIVGDGGINFNIQEFQTLKHYKLPVKVFIFNNYAYGITKAYRDTNFNHEYAGCDTEHGVSAPDFCKLATAYGLKSVRINDHDDLREKLISVLEADEPIICDINMNGFYEYNPKIGWKNPIEDMYPFLPRDEFRENMIIEPLDNWEKPEYP